MKKRVLSLCLAMCLTAMLSAMLSTSVHAEIYENYMYIVENEKATIIGMDEEMTTAVIPAEINGFPVVSIADNAFACSTIQSVTIPDSVTYIGTDAFWACHSLVSARISDNLADAGTGVFNNCIALETVNIPTGLKHVPYGMFAGCKSLQSIIIPDTITAIEDLAFYECYRLQNVTFGKNIKSIGAEAFANCMELKISALPAQLEFMGENAFNNNDALTALTIPEALTVIPASAFAYCDNLEVINLHNKLTTIGMYAFDCTKLKKISIPDSVTDLGEGAFHNCDYLTSVKLGKQITKIKDWTFLDCGTLSTIEIPDSVTEIGQGAFNTCEKLQRVYIGKGLANLAEYVFSAGTCLTEFNVAAENSKFSSVDGVLFNKVGTELIVYPNGKTGDYIIPPSVTRLRKSAFAYSNKLTGVILNKNIQDIPEEAFYKCEKLKSIIFPDDVKTIGAYAFDSSGLETICFGKGLLSIGNNAFSNLYELSAIFSTGTRTEWENVIVEKGNDYRITDGEIVFNYVFNAYRVTYDTNGGNEGMEYLYVPYGAATVIDAKMPTRHKHTFKGWAISADATTAEYQPGESVIFDADTTLYAVWSLTEYEVFFDPNGGVFNTGSLLFEIGKAEELPYSKPTRDKFSFVGWALKKNATEPTYLAGETIQETKDMKLYAVWKLEVYEVFYDAQGGEFSLVSECFSDGESAKVTTLVPESTASVFAGWATTPGAEKVEFMAGDTLTIQGDIVLYAVWKPVFEYEVTDNKATITGGSTLGSKLEIPEQIDGYTVVTIGNYAFQANAIKNLIIPDTVESIGEAAFSMSMGMETISLGKGVKTIGAMAFDRCYGVTEIEIPVSVKAIGDSALPRFLEKVYFEGTKEDWDKIEMAEFTKMELERIIALESSMPVPEKEPLGYTLKFNINGGAGGISDITKITPKTSIGIPEDRPGKVCGEFRGWALTSDATIPKYLPGERIVLESDLNLYAVYQSYTPQTYGAYEYYIKDGGAVITKWSGTTTAAYQIPDQINGYPVKGIGCRAFIYTAASEITVPNSVEFIDALAFYNASRLKVVKLGEGIKRIGIDSFQSCYALQKIIIGSNIKEIMAGAFRGCNDLTIVEQTTSELNWNHVRVSEGNESLLEAAGVYAIISDVEANHKDGYVEVHMTFSHALKKGSILVGLYNKEGALEEMIITGLEEGETEKDIQLPVKEIKRGRTMRIFTWEDIGSLKPMANCMTCTVK